jgi:hypothetical protein
MPTGTGLTLRPLISACPYGARSGACFQRAMHRTIQGATELPLSGGDVQHIEAHSVAAFGRHLPTSHQIAGHRHCQPESSRASARSPFRPLGDAYQRRLLHNLENRRLFRRDVERVNSLCRRGRALSRALLRSESREGPTIRSLFWRRSRRHDGNCSQGKRTGTGSNVGGGFHRLLGALRDATLAVFGIDQLYLLRQC